MTRGHDATGEEQTEAFSLAILELVVIFGLGSNSSFGLSDLRLRKALNPLLPC